ncbi:carbohydrate ABC transporter permease [Puniceicoccaceae bacterium K14]|nr:carbohydrate ABC transporter permease [Puniceicoccaceae bacterium K14]
MDTHKLSRTGNLILYTLLILFAISFAMPFAWMLSTALKPLEETMSLPSRWIPSKLQWQNFSEAIDSMGLFWRYTWNTLYLCVVSSFGATASSALAAYGFSRIDWPGRDRIFMFCVSTMTIPFPVIMVPVYTLFRELGWIGSFKPLWVPFFLGNAFSIFLLRQFFMAIPKDITEAARIDGASELRIFFQIILPMSRSALLVVALFTFMFVWNDFLGPMIYLTEQKQYTLALGLQAFQSQQAGTEWHYLMAASTLMILPLVFLFFLAQKSFIQGITTTGMKA